MWRRFWFRKNLGDHDQICCQRTFIVPYQSSKRRIFVRCSLRSTLGENIIDTMLLPWSIMDLSSALECTWYFTAAKAKRTAEKNSLVQLMQLIVCENSQCMESKEDNWRDEAKHTCKIKAYHRVKSIMSQVIAEWTVKNYKVCQKTNIVQTILQRNSRRANKISLVICQYYDNQENKHIDNIKECDTTSDKNESATKPEENFLDTLYALSQTDDVIPRDY